MKIDNIIWFSPVNAEVYSDVGFFDCFTGEKIIIHSSSPFARFERYDYMKIYLNRKDRIYYITAIDIISNTYTDL